MGARRNAASESNGRIRDLDKPLYVAAWLYGEQKHFHNFQLVQRFGALGQQPLTHLLAMSFCVMISRIFWYGNDPKK